MMLQKGQYDDRKLERGLETFEGAERMWEREALVTLSIVLQLKCKYSHPYPSDPWGLVPGPPLVTKICGCSSPLYKMYLHITCTHPPVCFKSSLGDL